MKMWKGQDSFHWIFLTRYHGVSTFVSVEPLDSFNWGPQLFNICKRGTTGHFLPDKGQSKAKRLSMGTALSLCCKNSHNGCHLLLSEVCDGNVPTTTEKLLNCVGAYFTPGLLHKL